MACFSAGGGRGSTWDYWRKNRGGKSESTLLTTVKPFWGEKKGGIEWEAARVSEKGNMGLYKMSGRARAQKFKETVAPSNRRTGKGGVFLARRKKTKRGLKEKN